MDCSAGDLQSSANSAFAELIRLTLNRPFDVYVLLRLDLLANADYCYYRNHDAYVERWYELIPRQ